MKLVRLVYASTMLESDLVQNELGDIKSSAERNNSKSEITGGLVFGNGYYLQCLEGGMRSINELFFKISKDKRHKDIVLLSYEDISKRDFPEWSMKIILLTEKQRNIVRQFSSSSEFKPYDMCSKSVYKFLLEINGMNTNSMKDNT